jgi:FAD binding domain
MRVFARTRAARLRRREILTNGASLIGQMLKALIDVRREPPIWTNTAMDDLIVEDGRVVGARVTRNGETLNVEARKGVLLAAGGFSRNADMRRRYSGNQPNDGQWSIANAGDTGEVLQTAMTLGAKTDLLDEAWWLPMVFIADPGAASLGATDQSVGDLYRFPRLEHDRRLKVRNVAAKLLAVGRQWLWSSPIENLDDSGRGVEAAPLPIVLAPSCAEEAAESRDDIAGKLSVGRHDVAPRLRQDAAHRLFLGEVPQPRAQLLRPGAVLEPTHVELWALVAGDLVERDDGPAVGNPRSCK